MAEKVITLTDIPCMSAEDLKAALTERNQDHKGLSKSQMMTLLISLIVAENPENINSENISTNEIHVEVNESNKSKPGKSLRGLSYVARRLPDLNEKMEIMDYLISFEKIMKLNFIDESHWTIFLLPKLKNQMVEICSELTVQECQSYAMLKRTMLQVSQVSQVPLSPDILTKFEILEGLALHFRPFDDNADVELQVKFNECLALFGVQTEAKSVGFVDKAIQPDLGLEPIVVESCVAMKAYAKKQLVESVIDIPPDLDLTKLDSHVHILDLEHDLNLSTLVQADNPISVTEEAGIRKYSASFPSCTDVLHLVQTCDPCMGNKVPLDTDPLLNLSDADESLQKRPADFLGSLHLITNVEDCCSPTIPAQAIHAPETISLKPHVSMDVSEIVLDPGSGGEYPLTTLSEPDNHGVSDPFIEMTTSSPEPNHEQTKVGSFEPGQQVRVYQSNPVKSHCFYQLDPPKDVLVILTHISKLSSSFTENDFLSAHDDLSRNVILNIGLKRVQVSLLPFFAKMCYISRKLLRWMLCLEKYS